MQGSPLLELHAPNNAMCVLMHSTNTWLAWGKHCMVCGVYGYRGVCYERTCDRTSTPDCLADQLGVPKEQVETW